MKVTIKATNLNLTPEIKKAIEEKIGTLDKFILHIPERSEGWRRSQKQASSPVSPSARRTNVLRLGTPVEAFVEVAIETRHHRKGKIYYAEATIKVPGEIIRSEARKENIYKALNTVKEELQVLLKKHKER